MPTKAELKKEADALGIDYPSDITKAALQALVNKTLGLKEPNPNSLGKCFNCDNEATWKSDGVAASVVLLCDEDRPDRGRGRGRRRRGR